MDQAMRERSLRAISECAKIAGMSEEPGRTTRRFLTPPVHDVHALLRARMEALEMDVRVDAAGNLRGLWMPANAGSRRLLLGSHIDTVPNAGAYDGVLGVAIGLEWVELAQQAGLPLAMELIAFSEEEGMRFGMPFLGSRAVAGRFDPALLALHDADGITMEDAIREFGLDPVGIDAASVNGNALGFVEVHIEQGPVLEAEGLGIAAVTGIVGQTRGAVVFSGQANHAGTTPMHLRRDALVAAAEWIARVETVAHRVDGLVATVGKIDVEPDAMNVIPGKASVSLDVRHGSDRIRVAAVEELLGEARTIAERRGITVEWSERMNEAAVPMDERLTSFMADAIEAAGFPEKTMTSGAGHDAMVMAGRMPTTMLFLRSPGGISHHPSESVRVEDVEAALHVGVRFLERVAAVSE
jgi:allantoate deiminase